VQYGLEEEEIINTLINFSFVMKPSSWQPEKTWQQINSSSVFCQFKKQSCFGMNFFSDSAAIVCFL